MALPRYGVFGGSFNPPHYGHIQLCNYVRRTMMLDRLILMPTGDNPFKDEGAVSREDRLEMLERAAAEIAGGEISRMEIDRSGKSYTVDTMAALTAGENAEMYFICGSDILFQLREWKDTERLCSLTRFITVLRQGVDNSGALYEAEALNGKYGARIALLTGYRPDGISSSEVRRRLAAGEDTDGLIPAAVSDYIERHGLYK